MIDADLITSTAAAARLGVRRQRVDQLRAEGRLVGARVLDRWVYSRADVERLAAEREARPRRAGRPAAAPGEAA